MRTINPVLLDFPSQFESERLTIRAPWYGDGTAIHQAVVETLDDLRAFPSSMLWALAQPSVQASELYARTQAANWMLRTNLAMLAFDKASGDLVVCSGLTRFDWSSRVFEIGWWCRKKFQGQGLATEAARRIMQFAFQDLQAQRVFAVSDTLNVRSCKLSERIGLKHEGTIRAERVHPNGQLCDMHVYGTTRNEWLTQDSR